MEYVLITAAKNEERYIGLTVDSVLRQTILPVCLVAVDDGSTDRTANILEEYSCQYNFIRSIRRPQSLRRDFANQVLATRLGYEWLSELRFDCVGILDGDIELPCNYYEFLLDRFADSPNLGVAGGAVIDKWRGSESNVRKGSETYHVAGGVQMFRRKCYEELGGYIALPFGGQDVIIEVMARMHGWSVRTFEDVKAFHLKADAGGFGSSLRLRFREGVRRRVLGSHPLYHLAHCGRRLFCERPYLLGGLISAVGYVAGGMQRKRVGLPSDVRQYLRREELMRLYKSIWGVRDDDN